MKNNILYIALVRLPTEKAHGVQIMKTCEAFSLLGTNTTLIVPNYNYINNIKSDPFDYYNVRKNFSLKKIFAIRLFYLGKFGFLMESIIFFIGLLFTREFWNSNYIFTRDESLAFFSMVFGRKVVWESHTGSYNFFTRQVLKKVFVLVVISNGLENFYRSRGFRGSIVVARDAVDLSQFDVAVSKEEARKELGLPLNIKIAMYVGKLDFYKGVETFLEASDLLEGVKFVIIGGEDQEIISFSNKYKNVIFLGKKPYRNLPIYQKAADVLIVPNSAKNIVSKEFTSPLKVFTYMASGIPIVASNIPSIRETLNDSNSILVSSDDPKSLSSGIHKVISNPDIGEYISRKALSDVGLYTWEARAGIILDKLYE